MRWAAAAMAVRRYGAAAVARGAALQPRCRGAAAAVAAQPSPCRNFSTTIASKPLPARTQRVVVEQILRAVGSAQDAEEFQRIYGSGERHYAVVKAGGEVIRDELDTFVAGLATMKAVGLFPIVVHGAGPQMNEVMDQQGIEPNYVGGLRVTDEHVLGVARKVFLEANLQLVHKLTEYGVAARPITAGVLQAEVQDPAIGFVGSITGLNTSPLESSLSAGAIPVLLPLAESAAGQVLNVNADVVAREVAIAMKPLKTIMINSKGGWVNGAQDPDPGQKLARISMAEHYEEMASRDYEGRQGTLLKLKELKLILDALPPPASISLTSAEGLARELFSHRGLGTTVTH
jgi:N-acetyl-gamma-glutamyl-phosphate reductase/acetylglutamate kinase